MDGSRKATARQANFEYLSLTLTKPEVGSKLGITLWGVGPPLVEKVAPGGLADGVLRPGDKICSVGGIAADGHDSTTKRLRQAVGTVALEVQREA